MNIHAILVYLLIFQYRKSIFSHVLFLPRILISSIKFILYVFQEVIFKLFFICYK